MTGAIDPSHALARHIALTRPTNLPEATIRATCRDIQDTFGCMLGGSGAPGIDMLRSVVLRAGGRQDATVLLSGARVPAQAAALVNGAMAHALDFDDTHDKAGSIHPGAPVLTAALAATEARGGISGREFVTAVALGLDVACRVALTARQDRGWHRTAAIGVFGATAAASRLMGLDPEKVRNALGIAFSQASGTRQCIDDGAMTKRFQAGQAASAGVLSALLAAEGFTGTERTFTGRYGFLALYQPEDVGNADRLTQGLGEVWEGDGLSLKPYPCFRPSHTAIDAAIALHRELRLGSQIGDIASVVIETDEGSWRDQLAPGTTRRRPAHVIEAQFATPFLVATALVKGRVTIDDVAEVANAAVLSLANNIEGRPVAGKERGWARLTVTLADGRSAVREVVNPSGSPDAPIDDTTLDDKFRDCARHAVTPLSDRAVTSTIAAIRTLPDAIDARQIFAALPMG
jgi:2-methylcitrate dehydratase PrpD